MTTLQNTLAPLDCCTFLSNTARNVGVLVITCSSNFFYYSYHKFIKNVLYLLLHARTRARVCDFMCAGFKKDFHAFWLSKLIANVFKLGICSVARSLSLRALRVLFLHVHFVFLLNDAYSHTVFGNLHWLFAGLVHHAMLIGVTPPIQLNSISIESNMYSFLYYMHTTGGDTLSSDSF